MTVKDKLKDKVWNAKEAASGIAKSQYIEKVMKWEDCDYEMAYHICIGRTDPREPEYTLGYKMADPVWVTAMFGQASKRKREQAIANFKEMLEPDELALFEEQVEPGKARDEYRAKKKEEERKSKSGKEQYVHGYWRNRK